MTATDTHEQRRRHLGIRHVQRPNGHAETDIGLLPTDWKVRRLGDLVTLKTGPFGSLLHKSDYVRDGVPLVNPIHMSDGRIVPDASTTVTTSAAERLSDFRLRAGDAVVARRGEMGRSAVVLEEQQGWVCGTGSMILRPKEDICSDFLQRVFSSPAIVSRITDASVGSTMVSLNNSTLSGLLIQCPRYAEQRAIAAALSDVDDLIGALDKLIAKKRAIKLATMQQLLTGKTRLPGFDGEWRLITLGELASIQRGASPRPIESPLWYDRASSIGWVRISDIANSDGRTLLRTRDYLSAKGVAASRFIPAGTLIMSICATVGRPVVTGFDTCIHDGFVSFSDLRHVDQGFLFYKLKELEPDFASMGQTGSQANLNTDLVKGCEMRLPCIDEQVAIAAILSDMDAEIAALEQRREKTKAIKQGMMQSLLTGRIRLVSPNRSKSDCRGNRDA